MTHHPALLLASTALLVAAISGGLAIYEASKAKDAARLASAAQIAEVRRIADDIRVRGDAASNTEFERRIAALEAARATTAEKTDLEALRAEISALRSTTDTLDAAERRIAALEAARATTVETAALDALRAEIAALRPAAAAVETVGRQLGDLETRLSALASNAPGTAIEALRGEIAGLRQNLATAQTVEAISRLLEETRTQMAGIAATTIEARATMAEIARRIEALETMPRQAPPTLEDLLAEASPAARDALGRFGLAATLAHPQQVMEAISAFVEEQRRIEAQGRPVPPALLTEIFDPGSGALRAGPAGAARRVAILTDHNCPFCRRAVALVRHLLERGDVEIVIHEMPILSSQSREAAIVAAAAARIDQRRALDLYLSVGAHEGRLDGVAMIEKAAGLGFDREALRRETEREETRQTVDRSLDLARRLGVTGTPGFVAQDLLIHGLQPDQVLQALSRPR